MRIRNSFQNKRLPVLGAALICAMSHSELSQAAADDLYYKIGGAAPFSVSAGRGYAPSRLGAGVRWNANASCGNFDMGATVSNQLNGATNGFQSLMGNVVNNATSAVASLPAMIIKRANPGLYDLINNGVLQGRVDYDKSKLSCQNMADRMADMAVGDGLRQRSMAENWQNTATSTQDAMAAQEKVEQESGNDGTTWIGGRKRGGLNQQPVRIVGDVATAGYNLLHGRSDPTSNEPISGGGQGMGSVSTNSGRWPGGGAISGGANSSSSNCKGGMCTVWATPDEAAEWAEKILGEKELRTCNGCEKSEEQAGTGLIRELENEHESVYDNLAGMVSGSREINGKNLSDVSAGDSLVVTRGIIEAIRSDPSSGLLVQRLSSEMAMARVLTKSLWARRMLLAGASEPGIASNEDAMRAFELKLKVLDREIDSIKSEMDIRRSLADNTAATILQRASNRATGSGNTESSQQDSILDNRGRPRTDAPGSE